VDVLAPGALYFNAIEGQFGNELAAIASPISWLVKVCCFWMYFSHFFPFTLSLNPGWESAKRMYIPAYISMLL
jgi:hypothetical protein